ncbi:MAG: hypothetical protein AB1485_02610 [Candidatus Thermoplasmatota archaeon]
MAAPIEKPKSKLPIVIAVGVVVAVVVIASVLWLFVFRKEKPEIETHPYFSVDMISWTQDDTNNSVTWRVVAVMSVGIGAVSYSALTYKLIDASTGNEVLISYVYQDTDGDGKVSSGDLIYTAAPADGDYVLKVLYENKLAFKSAATHY